MDVKEALRIADEGLGTDSLTCHRALCVLAAELRARDEIDELVWEVFIQALEDRRGGHNYVALATAVDRARAHPEIAKRLAE